MLKNIKISITKLQNKSGSSSFRANITAELSLLFDEDNNKLIIKKNDHCALCYNKCEEDSIEVNGNLICSKCVDEIRKGA